MTTLGDISDFLSRSLSQKEVSLIVAASEDRAENAVQALEDLLTLMRTPPEWAPDLPLDGEGGIADSYGDAK